MTWRPWRKRVVQADDRLREAEKLRGEAEDQQSRADQLAPRVEAVAQSLRRLYEDNHVGPMIESILRGNE